jgi:hypothetical protein
MLAHSSKSVLGLSADSKIYPPPSDYQVWISAVSAVHAAVCGVSPKSLLNSLRVSTLTALWTHSSETGANWSNPFMIACRGETRGYIYNK